MSARPSAVFGPPWPSRRRVATVIPGGAAGRDAGRAALAAVLAGGAGWATGGILRRSAPPVLDRSAHVGRPVSLAGGPVAIVGSLCGAAVAGRLRILPVILATAVAGLLDDLVGTGAPGDATRTDAGTGAAGRSGAGPKVTTGTPGRAPATGDAEVRGLRGHLHQLWMGQVTTGVGKVVLIGGGALITSVLLRPGGPGDLRCPRSLGRAAVDAAMIAGTANLANLLDLRPGRAGKALAVLAAGLLILPDHTARDADDRGPRANPGPSARVLSATVLGTLAAELPADLAGRWMLGDAGANTLGALTGSAIVSADGPRLTAAWLVVVVALTLLSERVSFSAAISANPVLAWLDDAGTAHGR